MSATPLSMLQRISSATARLLREIDPDALTLGVEVHRRGSQLAPEAAHLDAAEGRGRIEIVVGVDPDGARADRPRHPVSLLDVPCPDPRGQPVDRLVGQADAVVEILE